MRHISHNELFINSVEIWKITESFYDSHLNTEIKYDLFHVEGDEWNNPVIDDLCQYDIN